MRTRRLLVVLRSPRPAMDKDTPQREIVSQARPHNYSIMQREKGSGNTAYEWNLIIADIWHVY